MVEAMEIQKGFKQTEVGVIPSDWEVRKLSEIGNSIIGLTYNPSNVKPYGTLVLRSSNVQNGKLAFEDNVYVNMELPKRVIVKENDVLICVRNGSRQLIGKCALIDRKAAGSAFGAFMSIYRSEFSNYIFHQFQSFIVQRQINETLGATINQITNKDLALFQIPFPPTKTEQAAIANVLNDADELIAALEKLIAKKRNIKQGSMQKLLQPKEGWVVKKLGDLFQLSASSSKIKFVSNGGKFIVMDMGSVSIDGKIIRNKATNLHLDILDVGDLVMPKDDIGGGNIIGKVGFIDKHNAYVLSDHVYRLRMIEIENDSLFFYYLINSIYVNKYLRMKASGSAQLGLGRKSVEEQEVCFPKTKARQTAIATILSDMDTEIETLEKKLEKYKMVKQGMMQELLMGKTRLI